MSSKRHKPRIRFRLPKSMVLRSMIASFLILGIVLSPIIGADRVASGVYTIQVVTNASFGASPYGNFHRITWVPVGTVSACSVRLDISNDGASWVTVIGPYTCTSQGTGVSASAQGRYARVNVTSLTGGYLVVGYEAFNADPSAGGGPSAVSVTSGTINTGTVQANAGTGTQNVACVSGCGGVPSFTDTGAFTFGTTPIAVIGGVVDDAATHTVADGLAAAPRISASRIMFMDLKNTQANSTNLNVTTTVASMPSVSVTSATVGSMPSVSVTSGTIGQITMPSIAVGTFSPSLTVTSGTIGSLPSVSVTSGTIGSITMPSLTVTSATVGQMPALSVTSGTIGSLPSVSVTSGTIGSITMPSLTVTSGTIGQLPAITGTVQANAGTGTFNTTFATGTLTGSLPAGTNNIGTVGVTGTVPINLANVLGAAMSTANPVVSGGRAATDTTASVANGAIVSQAMDRYGRTIMVFAPQELWATANTATLTATTASAILAAPGANYRWAITGWSACITTGTVATRVDLLDGTTAKMSYPFAQTATTGGEPRCYWSGPFQPPFLMTANTAVNVALGTAATDVRVVVTGFKTGT